MPPAVRELEQREFVATRDEELVLVFGGVMVPGTPGAKPGRLHAGAIAVSTPTGSVGQTGDLHKDGAAVGDQAEPWGAPRIYQRRLVGMEQTPGPAGRASEGPFLAAALLCERVLTEQDGVLSLIRVVDRLTHTIVGPEAPPEMPPVRVNWQLVLIFKSGAARGRFEVVLQLEAPSGLKLGDRMVLPVFFEGEERGVQLIAGLELDLNQEGLYWIDVLLDDSLVTRVPFRVIYQRITRSSSVPG